jgi:methylated-DNA-[protein]-cysteine S-methyltransferase
MVSDAGQAANSSHRRRYNGGVSHTDEITRLVGDDLSFAAGRPSRQACIRCWSPVTRSENREPPSSDFAIYSASAQHEDRTMDRLVFQLERVPAPCGHMLVVTDDQENVRALDWENYETRMHRLLRLYCGTDNVHLETRRSASTARRSLEAYLTGDLRAIDGIPVKTRGTPFQQQVWTALRTIPAGTTLSYGALAKRVGRPTAVRAVGAANGANPICIIIPCHRVIGADASLTGYGGGLQRKRFLLEHEGVRLPGFGRAA